MTTGPSSPGEIQSAVETFAREAHGGLIVTPTASALMYREIIIGLAARHRLPSIYYTRLYSASGGLMSYGVDIVDLHRGAALYVDRILRGAKAADLPVQLPTKYQLVINLKSAKAIDHVVPAGLVLRADEVIE